MPCTDLFGWIEHYQSWKRPQIYIVIQPYSPLVTLVSPLGPSRSLQIIFTSIYWVKTIIRPLYNLISCWGHSSCRVFWHLVKFPESYLVKCWGYHTEQQDQEDLRVFHTFCWEVWKLCDLQNKVVCILYKNVLWHGQHFY